MPADRANGPVVLLGFDAADPDLVERWAREGKLPHPFHRGSHHTAEGLLVAAGPGVRPAGRLSEVSPLALAPTLLTLLDVDPPAVMTEAPLHGWLAESPVLADTDS